MYKPEEVVATEESTVAAETLVAQEAAAVGALHACAVPRPAEDVQQELVDDRQLDPAHTTTIGLAESARKYIHGGDAQSRPQRQQAPMPDFR